MGEKNWLVLGAMQVDFARKLEVSGEEAIVTFHQEGRGSCVQDVVNSAPIDRFSHASDHLYICRLNILWAGATGCPHCTAPSL